MKYLIAILILFVCTPIFAQDKNVFLQGEFWKTEPTVKEIKKKIKEGHDPSASDSYSFDGVAYAIINNAPIKSIKHMLKQEGNPVTKPTHGSVTYLLWSAYKDNVAAMKHLIDLGSDVQLSTSGGTNILMMAAVGGVEDQAVYDLILSKNVDINTVNSTGANALHQLASSGVNDESIFQYLVDKGLSWDSEDNNGNGLFNYAARGSNIDLLKLCVSKGLNHSTLNTDGENSLFYASYARKRGAVKLQVFHYIESLGLEVDLVNWEGKTPLHNAIRYADVELIDYFLQRGVNINQIDEDGNTTLLNSIGGPIANVKKVLPLVANTNHKNKKGYTPLTLAVQRGSKEVYDFLVKNELDVNVKDTEGNNLIYHAFESYRDSNEESFDYLITSLSNQLGINNDKVFFGGNTLAHIAVKKNSPYLLSRAISLGADLNHKNEDGVTPLHMAAMSANDDKLILALLNSGADKNILTAFQESAYDLATQNELLKQNRTTVDILKTQ